MANTHSKEQREFIVRRLAAYDTVRDVVEAFAVRFPDTACDEKNVWATDPRVALLDPDLHMLFTKERAAVLVDPNIAEFAEQQARVIVLSGDAVRYGNNRQFAERRAVLRQIAEELGVVGGKTGASTSPSKAGELNIGKIELEIVDPASEPPPEQ